MFPQNYLQLSAADIPVVILAGGKGIRLGKNNATIPKTMVEINDRPVLSYLLAYYLQAGFKQFIICAGVGMNMVEAYLRRNYADSDIKIVDTGIVNMTGSRLAQVRKLIKNNIFCMTYGDTLADVNVKKMISNHLHWKATATLLAVHNPTRFKILGLMDEEYVIKGFSQQPVLQKDYINGGFYVFDRSIFELNSLSEDVNCVLENEVLEELVALGKLCAYRYDGFWQPLDNERDLDKLAKYFSH